jgi:hypothetical protein
LAGYHKGGGISAGFDYYEKGIRGI